MRGTLQIQNKDSSIPTSSFTPVRFGLLQRQTTNQAESTVIPPIVHEVLHSPGRALDQETRTFMESRFGHDFSQVRVYTDTKAAKSAKAINAIAYTVSQNIVLGAGQYAPRTREGRQLLAHELTHVVQQTSNTVQHKLTISAPKDKYEQEADAMARAVTSMQPSMSNRTERNDLFVHPHGKGLGLYTLTPRIQRLVAESEFFVHGIFIQVDYDNTQVTDAQIRQLLRTLELLPWNHLAHIPTITVGNRPPDGGGGAAHSGMPGGPYIRLNQNIFSSPWNRGTYNETLLHEAGHIVDWAYGCMTHMRRENPAGYRALLAHPHRGRRQGPSEHFADAYADYYLGRRMSDERRSALLTSQAYII